MGGGGGIRYMTITPLRWGREYNGKTNFISVSIFKNLGAANFYYLWGKTANKEREREKHRLLIIYTSKNEQVSRVEFIFQKVKNATSFYGVL